MVMDAGVEGEFDGYVPLDGVEADGLGMQGGEREGPRTGGGGGGEGELGLGVGSLASLAIFFLLLGLSDPCGVVTHGRGAARQEEERWVVCRGAAPKSAAAAAPRSAAAAAVEAGGGAGPS